MATTDPEIELLTDLYEEHGATLHRLAVLLGADSAAEHVVRAALLGLGRRRNRLVDPVERVEYLQEQMVHLCRTVRAGGPLALPEVEDHRQRQILQGVRALPVRIAEVLVISHFLSVFGPELAGILRLTVRGTNVRLEGGLDALRTLVGAPVAQSQPGVIESLSQELTAALRSSARTVQAPDAEAVAAELSSYGGSSRHGISTWLAAVVIAVSLLVGAWLATITSSGRGDPGMTATPSASPASTNNSPSSQQSRSLPAQVRSVPVYYVGRADGLLYRELRDLPAGGLLLRAALGAILSLAPLDPDYGSAWGPGSVTNTELTGNVLTVDLTPSAYEGIQTPEHALRAANQMLYTAAELSGNPNLRLKLLMDGHEPPPAFQLPAGGLGRTGLGPMPPVWISWPKNGATTAAGQLVIFGTVKPETSAPVVTVAADGGETVASVIAQTATSADADGWRPWSVSVELAPGSYLITAVTQMPGATGVPRAFSETKSITVS